MAEKHSWVVWDGPEGTDENAVVESPGLPDFTRSVPVMLSEEVAKHLVERSAEKAGEVEDPLPPHFRYADKAEVAPLEKALKKEAKEAEAAAAAAAEPAEPPAEEAPPEE